jgi:hypothetical protein
MTVIPVYNVVTVITYRQVWIAVIIVFTVSSVMIVIPLTTWLLQLLTGRCELLYVFDGHIMIRL